jgi:hypothetical protein
VSASASRCRSETSSLAGDAAHMVTPAGGKGMNMAILDAIELASAICECCGTSADEARLGRYSAARMPEIWRYEEFSNWMLGLLHPSHALRGDGSLAAQEFAFGLRRARLDRMVSIPICTLVCASVCRDLIEYLQTVDLCSAQARNWHFETWRQHRAEFCFWGKVGSNRGVNLFC